VELQCFVLAIDVWVEGRRHGLKSDPDRLFLIFGAGEVLSIHIMLIFTALDNLGVKNIVHVNRHLGDVRADLILLTAVVERCAEEICRPSSILLCLDLISVEIRAPHGVDFGRIESLKVRDRETDARLAVDE